METLTALIALMIFLAFLAGIFMGVALTLLTWNNHK